MKRNRLGDRPIEQLSTVIEHYPTGGDLPQDIKIVADHQHSASRLCRRRQMSDAFCAKVLIADRQHFVDHQDVGIDMRSDSERQPDEHSRRIVLHRCVDEFVDPSKVQDAVETIKHRASRQPQDCPIEEDVVTPRQLQMEAGADFQHARYATAQFDAASRGRSDATHQFKECRFAGAVVTQEGNLFPGGDRKVELAQGPELVPLAGRTATTHPVGKGLVQ